jgi:hypothetical protein
LLCALPLPTGSSSDSLASLVELAHLLWSELANKAQVGPVFSIRPLGLSYPRPRPPRHSTLWPLGDAAYFISDEFHRAHPLGDEAGVSRLKAQPLAQGIVRESSNGLTVVRVKGPAEQAAPFALQRHQLEVWMSVALELPLHPEFRTNGDRRMSVLLREGAAEPFSFYDAMRRIAFKAVVEAPAGELDDRTTAELANILKLDTLQDGRPVGQTIVIFPSREAALQNAALVKELGGSGSVYVGDDRRLWEPRPPGQWIEVNWERLR